MWRVIIDLSLNRINFQDVFCHWVMWNSAFDLCRDDVFPQWWGDVLSWTWSNWGMLLLLCCVGRGRGLGRRGRPAQASQSAYRQAWLSSQQGQRAMDASDPTECEDGGSGSRSLGSGEGASASSSDLALAVPSTAATADDTSDSQG